jgi:uncharacterized protein YyaL (SSP411 family)
MLRCSILSRSRNIALQYTNRLAASTSPYLLQHRSNPVDWWQWGPDALAEARRSKKPILLSIGYAACHWCHVMAHESFEDPATAAVMNALFVNIKVDREERPDIDQIYMAALHHLGEQGGWPLTMFLTPDGEPVWGGTYFPKESRYGRPAFVHILNEVARLFREEPEKITANRDALVARLRARNDQANAAKPITIGLPELDNAAASIARATDPVNGGLRGAPKFPQCAMLEFLWRAGARTNDARFFDVVALTLDRISQGGIYDHIGGGYSRYSVDERWLVPHFEKMLYDNAQLLDLLALEFSRTGSGLLRDRATETVDWLVREMVTAEGGFASSLDADSEGEEGKYYVWSLAEIEQALGAADAALFAENYDITAGGNFEGHNIPNRLNDLPRSPADAAKLAMLRSMLQQIRSKRVHPGLDDKVLVDWNGLMIAALANAARILQRPEWLALARRAFEFVRNNMTHGDQGAGRLGHSWRAGQLLIPGLASDYAAMIRAALALFEAEGRQDDLSCAIEWQRSLDQHYADHEHGGYYLTANDAEALVVRPHSTIDDAIPNHNGLIAQNLVRLATLSGDNQFRTQADQLFDVLLPVASDNVFGHLSLLNALDLRLCGKEIVVTGEGDDAEALLQIAKSAPPARHIILYARRIDALPQGHPARAKLQSTEAAAAFICTGEACSLPINDPAALKAELALQKQ